MIESSHDEQINEHDGKGQPAKQALGTKSAHGFKLAANTEKACPRGKDFSLAATMRITSLPAPPRIAILNGRVDIDNAPDVVVRNHSHHRCCARWTPHPSRIFGACRAGCSDRYSLQILHGLHGVLAADCATRL